MMEWLISGHAIDVILARVAIEAFALVIFRIVSGQGPATLALIANLLSGAFLLLALRNALGDGGPWVLMSCLTAALIAHFADLVIRWENRGATTRPPMRATLTVRVSESRSPQARRAPNDESSDA